MRGKRVDTAVPSIICLLHGGQHSPLDSYRRAPTSRKLWEFSYEQIAFQWEKAKLEKMLGRKYLKSVMWEQKPPIISFWSNQWWARGPEVERSPGKPTVLLQYGKMSSSKLTSSSKAETKWLIWTTRARLLLLCIHVYLSPLSAL